MCLKSRSRPAKQIDIEPGGWIYKDRTVQMQTMFQKLSTGLFASAGQICLEPFHRAGKNRAAIHVLPHGRRGIGRVAGFLSVPAVDFAGN